MTWAALKPWSIMALIFGVGMVAGGALVIAFHPGSPPNPPGAVQQFRAHWMMHLSHRLNLTPDQQAKIEPIVAEAIKSIDSLHSEEIAKLGQIMDAANEKIEPYLTADQQARLKEMMSERPHEFPGRPHPWEGPHPPGPGPGPGAGFPRGDGPPDNAPPATP